ncbi:MAG: molybdopterin-dependent oxidoreductase [Planctomycetota bacterium]
MASPRPTPSPHAEVVHRSCPICEACCGLRLEVDRATARVLSVRGDEDDPRSRGYLCPKATAMQGIHADPDRIRRPLRRTAAGWKEMDWEEALALVGSRLHAIREAHGKDAVGTYIGNPLGFSLSGLLYVPMYVRALDTERLFSAATMDQLPKNLSSRLLFGDAWAIPIPDVDRTHYLLVLGGNPVISQGSLMSAPNVKQRFAALRARGGRLVVVDPRRSETAACADRHLSIHPGTDAFFLLALVHVLFDEDRVDPGRLAAFSDGIETLRRLAGPFPPDAVASVTGIEAGAIRVVASEFAAAPSAVCYGRIGTCTQRFGTLASWLVDVVNVLTGNLDRPGGAMFPRPATGQTEPHVANAAPLPYARWRSRVRGLPEFDGQLPVAAMAEEMEAESAGGDRIRGFVTVCGNPVLSSPNGERLGRALEQLEFMVSIDVYRNETTRYADVILPTTTQLEHANYDFLFQGTAVRNFARWSPRVFEASPGAKDLGRVLTEVAARMNGATAEALDDLLFGGMLATFVGRPGSPCADMTIEAARAKLGAVRGPERLLDLMLRAGPFGDRFDDAAEGLSFAKLERVPHALDLGPLEPRLPEMLRTEGGRLDLAPEILVKDVERLRQALAEHREDDGRLVLVGRRQMRDMNSWLHNVPGLAKGRDRCRLLVSPVDAERLGLREGEPAKVRSRAGAVTARVTVSDEMMPGVVSLPHGFGHGDPAARLSVAAAMQPGANSNQLCDEHLVDAPSGTSVANGIPVEVSPA